ncbi:MAG: TonB-dependent receptor domain-containing protein, partial [bacterium]
LKPRREISPAVLVRPELVSPFASYVPRDVPLYVPLYVPARYTRIKALPLMEYGGKKELPPPFVQIPWGKRVYYPDLRKESPLPYLHLSMSLATRNSFSYRLDYGRQKERFTGFLSAGSVSTPRWVKYEPEELNLGKHEETIASELIWGSLTNKTMALNLERQAKKIDLPNEPERNKNKIEIRANWRQEWKRSIFTVDGWANRSALKDSKVDQEDVALGTGLELRLKKIPLDIGVSVDNSSFTDKTQTHFWLEDDAITFKRMKEITLGLGGGMKAITGSGSQFLPSLRLTYRINPSLQLEVGGKRHFYLAQFSDLYLPQDYVEINEDLDPVRIWHYEIKLEYKLSPLTNLSLVGFYKEGEDTIWNWNSVSSLARPEIREMNVSGGGLNFLLHFGEAFEQGLSYTYQKAENAQDKSKVIPHYPQNVGDLWLIWSRNGWAVELGAKFIGKRYYEETTEEKLDSGWIERFRISKKMGKAIEWFTQLELNDYLLWKNYPLSKEKLSLGLKVKLY